MEQHRQSTVTSKFVAIYTKLLQGTPPAQLDAKGDARQLFSDLLDLKVDSAFLTGELQQLSKDTCLGRLKPFLNMLFDHCLQCASTAVNGEARKDHALETLTIASRCCLSKNLSGWEVMDLIAGSVGQSDSVFNDFTSMLSTIIGDETSTRHRALRLGFVFVCTISQLSPGAYFLRRNLFPSIVTFVKSRETEAFVMDAALFLAILANYHKSDAARMNPYLKRIKECQDDEFMRKICRSIIPPIDKAVKAYTSDESLQGTGVGATLTSLLRPDRLMSRLRSNSNLRSKTPVDGQPQPIAQAVALLPIYEFMAGNPTFTIILLEDLENTPSPWISSFLSLASWLFTNASSASSSRTMAYASLVLEMQLVLVENASAMNVLYTRPAPGLQLCQQALISISDCLDCHMHGWGDHSSAMSAPSYSKCVWICHRTVWYLQRERLRLDYHWKELWVSVLGLFSFLAGKIDTLLTTGGIGQLILDSLAFLDAAVGFSESYLPTPHAVHELVYELVRNSESLEKQRGILESVEASPRDSDALQHLLDITFFYKEKILATGTATKEASDVFRIIIQEIELHGLHRPDTRTDREPSIRAEEVLDFARHACSDGLGLA
ncbi:hypothetical protein D9611_005660 [Ephemerocybe angulata]|uniref:Armadillo-like helical domain-containing protein n=1 Tax=Ephemerocybe angulata TaxID=980116 RepID=A0A8H5BI93_9AGAR|nr:hypothetical protein D9611_005660 [Tulosesus angulatus]